MINILMIGLFRLLRRDRRTPRAIGFLMVGSAASLAVFTSCVASPGQCSKPFVLSAARSPWVR